MVSNCPIPSGRVRGGSSGDRAVLMTAATLFNRARTEARNALDLLGRNPRDTRLQQTATASHQRFMELAGMFGIA